MRTLCVCCHAVVTASQAKDRAKRKGQRQEVGGGAEEGSDKARPEGEAGGDEGDHEIRMVVEGNQVGHEAVKSLPSAD